MNSSEVARFVREEIGEQWSRSNDHGVDLRRCLVTPRKIRCRNTFPHPDRPKPRHLDLWLVLEETPDSPDGYLIVFDDSKEIFGLACHGARGPAFLGWHGGFWDTLEGM